MNENGFKFTEVFNYAKKIALSSKDQVRYGGNPKAPCVDWDKQPDDYKGFNDNNYGTAIVCDYINDLNQYLVVIDLDVPKHDDHIPIDVLKECIQFAINDTYSVKSASGGYHIYLLSEKKPIAKQPKLNIDYKHNGYIIADYRYNKAGDKEYYTKLEESPEIIYSVENADVVLNKLLTDLEDKGHSLTPKTEYLNQIATIITKNLRKGNRNDLVFYLSGYLRKKSFDHDTTTQIVRIAFKDDEELTERLQVVNRAYKQDMHRLNGWKGLNKHLNSSDLKELEALVGGDELSLKNNIMRTLAKQVEPKPKLLANYLNSELTLYKDPKLMKYYERKEDGTIIEINSIRIEEFMNGVFGNNQITASKCKSMLNYVTNHIKRNYDIILFNNGYLNTRTREFNPNKSELEEIPKLSLPFNYNSEAKEGRIKTLLDDILNNPKYPNDKELWLRVVGHAFIGANRIGKMVMVQGESGTGKSTLSTILKRVFTGSFSEVKTQAIVRNERFTLHSLIGNSINIDDDIANGMLKGIGNLNTLITGNGLEVEIKGENRKIQAEAEQIPKLFANGNTLPPIVGTGIERRLLLIHANNQISYEKKDDYLQADILSGKYDKDGIEWLIYTAINLYLDMQDEPLTNKAEEERMKREYDYKAYPLKCAIEEIFEDSYEEMDYIDRKDVYKYLKQWSKQAYKKGLISSEHRKPSAQQINKAMDKSGYSHRQKKVNLGSLRVYEDIRLKDHYKQKFTPETNQQDQITLIEA
ncbi:MAG: hypothetical protein HZC47_01010 [Methanobacterium sp.]|uniref:DUF5906 domain-containing protein n=1 Tax=Methanobacterium sp. TaxID=2164 RepID=UPI003D64A39F|nr:hypothetical protein [Methanobacterium sp.]